MLALTTINVVKPATKPILCKTTWWF